MSDKEMFTRVYSVEDLVVFRDSNGNQRQDSGEAVIANQRVFLDANNNGTLDPQGLSFSSGSINFARPISSW